jgi:glycosyltransferase involved in cell wall biosynthesis
MRVLYVSKALATAAYRDKLHSLAAHVDVRAVMPEEWRPAVESPECLDSVIRPEPVLFGGHNHLHVYRRPSRFLEDPRPDLVHIDEEPYSAVTSQLLRHCLRRRLVALFFTWQNVKKRLPPPFDAMRRFALRRASGAIAGGERAAEVLKQLGYHGPLAVIPQFGVDPGRFAPDKGTRQRTRARLEIPEAAFVVGFAGRLVREKGLYVLLEAVGSLPDVFLVVVGDGREGERLSRAARRTGLPPRVRFVRHVSSTEIASWLNAFDVVALPSLTARHWMEQFGRILVEAMSCGLPVVGSDSGEISRVIGDAGIVVPEGNAAALAAALGRLARTPALCARFAQRGRERVLARFTNERIAAATADFYHEVATHADRT